uniref:Tigger transposable element-derived protein 6 n=1 Tax=Rhipicephalus zambeziensis TaxID=60191 RepID=A0A224Z1D2_9ACAR
MSSRQPRRKTLSFEEKIALINAVTSRKGKKKDVAARFGVRPSTLSTILKHKDRIFTAVSSGTSGSRKKLRASNYQDVEKALLRWVLDMRTRNVPLSGAMLQEKARDVACRLGCDDFKASPGWLMRFKNRHASLAGLRRGEWLPLPDLNGGAVLEDVEDVLDAVRDYRTRDVYAAQETALFYGVLPHETRAFKEDPCIGGSRSAQRLTVFLCSNMDGSDKRPPLVVGKSDRPKCFRGSKCVPIKYASHPKAWMTPLLFCNWLCDFNASMAEQGRSVCLLVSRCTAHIVGQLALSNVRLCYVSADAHSSLPCPLNLGVVNRLKCAYRQSLIERFLLNIRLDRDLTVDLYQALQMLVEAWKCVRPATILSCFQRAGIDAKPDLSQLSREKDVENVGALPPALTKSWHLLHMCGFVPENVSLGDYVYCDAWAATVEEENGEVILGSLQNDLLFEDLEDRDGVVLREPSLRDVLEAIDLLRVHAGSREEFDVAFEAIELYESSIKAVLWKQIQAAMKLEQGSIVSGVELLAEAALTATERLDTQVILLGDADHIKTEEEAVVTTQSLEATDAEVAQVEQEEVYIGADEQQLQHEPPAEPEPEPVEVVEQPHHEPETAAHSDVEHMEVEVEEPVVVMPVQPQTSAQPQQRETSHSSAESGPVAVPLVPIQPADINYSDDSQSKSLPGLTGASTHHQPTGFDSSMFKMGAPLPEISQPQAVPQADVAAPAPPYPSTATVPVGVFSLSVTPSTSLGGVSSATGGEADDAVGSVSVSSKVHKDKKKKKKKDKKHKHKHKHRSHDRLLEKERFYSSGGSTNQSPAPFGGGASSSPQHEII